MVYQLYQHYKGGYYRVIDVAQHTETGESLVVYKDTNGKVWVRPSEMFHEFIENEQGQTIRRFEYVGVVNE